MIDCANNEKDTIQDRTIYDGTYLLPIYYQWGLVTNRDYKNYESILRHQRHT